jgi:predicted O-linked N-acetylglucosamine transferase (SPINDLY family)
MMTRQPAASRTDIAAQAARHLREASALHQQGRLAEAERCYIAALGIVPDHPDALHFLGVLKWQQGRKSEGLALIERALLCAPGNVAALYNRANVLRDLERNAEALAGYDAALAVKPDHLGALVNRAAVLHTLGRYEEAVDACGRAIVLRPNAAALFVNRANALTQLGRHGEALAGYDAALRLASGDAAALYGRGNALLALGRGDEAVESYNRALIANPGDAEILDNRGLALMRLRRHDEAIASFTAAIASRPDRAEPYAHLGNALVDIGRYADAVSCFDQALARKPDFAAAHFGRGYALIEAKRPDQAIHAFEAVARIDLDYPYGLGMLLYAKRHCCDWRGDAELVDRIVSGIRESKRVATPLILLASDSAADKLRCAQILMRDKCPARQPLWRGERYRHGSIRVAYLSADLHDHAMARLAAGVFEHHDRSRFETAAFAYGPDDRSAMRTRLERAFDRFLDVRSRSDGEIAQAIRDWEADIAVDLTGLTGPGRPGILAFRPAPVQASWLGFAGSMGADFIDYLIADPVAIPEREQAHYPERIACLPHCCLPHDSKRAIGTIPSREAAGLPPRGFVFASFNSAAKFTPDIFRIWMRLLARVADSVLWLPAPNAAAARHLQEEARAHAIDPERIVFAPFAPKPEDHVARLALADLFLDTSPYNSHSTALDALFAGVPIVTRIGESFAARLAASALIAAGLPELVTESDEAYESLAVTLAADPERLADLKRRLTQSRGDAPLVDTAGVARDLGALYTQMCRRQQNGIVPDALSVSRDGR